jgi:hypothetical protein
MGKLNEVIEWCQRHCTGDWRFMDSYNDTLINSWTFLFNSEQDYTLFLLRWA